MENASKALFIVVGVFLGLLLLSLMIYVFSQGAKVNETYDQKQITNQLELYNSKFEQYDKDNNNIMDVISLCNLAFDANVACEFDPALAVQIEILTAVDGTPKFELPNTNFIKERNKIRKIGSSNPMDIYNLAVLKLQELNISSLPQKHSLQPGLEMKNVTINLAEDTFSTTKLKNGKTIYKYLFMVKSSDDFEYHESNLKVSKIKLTAYCNPEWND